MFWMCFFCAFFHDEKEETSNTINETALLAVVMFNLVT